MTLKVIDGGKPSAPAANGGAGTVDAFKWHPFAEALFDACYPKDAKTFQQVVDRMSKVHRGISHEDVGRCLRHVRDHEFDYGWTIPPVQKGSGEFRRYFAVLVDGKDIDSKISDEHLVCFERGMYSTCKTVATMTKHALGAAEIVSESSGLGRGHRRQYRALATQLAGADAIAQELLQKLA